MLSVVVATYNGEKYITEQLDSILNQLSKSDEVVISDDGSNDNTLNIIKKYQKNNPNIILLDGPRQGVIKNFQFGIENCHGDIIFLADQDDIWLPNKVQRVVSIFDSDSSISCVLHDVSVVDKSLNVIAPSFFELRKSKKGFVHNLIKNSFMGSAMAFRSTAKNKILPIPGDVPMHDQWIGLLCYVNGRVVFSNDKLGLYRRHGENVSNLKHGSIRNMIKKRVKLIMRVTARICEK